MANAQKSQLVLVQNSETAPKGGWKEDVMDFIPLSSTEQKLLKRIYKCNTIEAKDLKPEYKEALFSLASQGLISDHYRSLTHTEQNKPGVKSGEKFFINDNGKRHYINLKQQSLHFLLPIVISVLALLVSLGTMLVNIFSNISPCV